MADDVQPITGTTAKVAARLCNFVTSKTFLLISHQVFLDKSVQPVIRGMQGPWVDLFGYASRKGGPGANLSLSQARIASVKWRISEYANHVNFQISSALGESVSTGVENDDDGYWRAVEVYVYATRPPIRKQEAPDDGLSRAFRIRIIGGTSVAKGVQFDDFDFEIMDTKRQIAATFRYQGWGGSVPGIPGIPLSTTRGGPEKPFTTSSGVALSDFAGTAQLFQDPGASAGPFSIPGSFARLSIESEKLLLRSARILPRQIIPLEGGGGWQSPSLGSATSGELTMRGAIRAHR